MLFVSRRSAPGPGCGAARIRERRRCGFVNYVTKNGKGMPKHEVISTIGDFFGPLLHIYDGGRLVTTPLWCHLTHVKRCDIGDDNFLRSLSRC